MQPGQSAVRPLQPPYPVLGLPGIFLHASLCTTHLFPKPLAKPLAKPPAEIPSASMYNEKCYDDGEWEPDEQEPLPPPRALSTRPRKRSRRYITEI